MREGKTGLPPLLTLDGGGARQVILVQALITAILSGLFSGAILFALNERRDRANLLLTKIEATIEAYATWIALLLEWPRQHFDLFYSEGRDEARREVERLFRAANAEQEKARFLQEVYLPDESEALSAVVRSYRDFIIISRDLQLASLKAGGLPEGASDQISQTLGAIIEAGHAGTQCLYAAARQRAHAPFLIRGPKLTWPFRSGTS